MKKNNYLLAYVLMVILQILVCNYCNFTHFITLSILPVTMLLIPVRRSSVFAMLCTFATGLVVDLLAEGGLPGLNALALVPVSFCRKAIL